MAERNELQREIAVLASHFDGGELLADTMPAQFLRVVTAEIATLRRDLDRLNREAVDARGCIRTMRAVIRGEVPMELADWQRVDKVLAMEPQMTAETAPTGGADE